MTIEEVAAKLNGCEIGTEDNDKGFLEQAKRDGIVIVFGASDDLMEFRGAINDEVGCYDGGTVEVSPEGLVPDFEQIDKDDKEALRKYFLVENRGVKIDAVWDEGGISWQYKTSIPHATFEVMEDGDIYCRGIVFRLADCTLT